MSRVVRISETIFQRLQKLAIPLEDTLSSVIERLLDFYDSKNPEKTYKKEPLPSHTQIPKMYEAKSKDNHALLNVLLNRRPRQRGIIVEIGGNRFDADSLHDLYGKILKFLDDRNQLEKLKPYLPFSTSKKRYLIAYQPVHPNGNEFVRPVEYKGYFMEAHKDYKNGIISLQRMLDRLGLSLSYIE